MSAVVWRSSTPLHTGTRSSLLVHQARCIQSFVRIASMSCSVRLTHKVRSINSGSKGTVRRGASCIRWETPTSDRLPSSFFHRYSNSSRSKSILACVYTGAICFSNLVWASVLIHNLMAVFLTTTGSNCATSMRIRVVVSETPLLFPHTTQARASIHWSSQITISCSVRACSVSNKSINVSPWAACLTTSDHCIVSASKQWIGCPVRYIK